MSSANAHYGRFAHNLVVDMDWEDRFYGHRGCQWLSALCRCIEPCGPSKPYWTLVLKEEKWRVLEELWGKPEWKKNREAEDARRKSVVVREKTR